MPSNLEEFTSSASGHKEQMLLFTAGGENPTIPWEEAEAQAAVEASAKTIGKTVLDEAEIEPPAQ